MLLVSSLIAAGTALLRIGTPSIASAFAAMTFLAASLVSVGGWLALGEGKRYHRHAVAKSVLIGDALGLTHSPSDAAADATYQLVSGMTRRKAQGILAKPDAYVTSRIRRSGFQGWVRITFMVLTFASALGGLMAVYMALSCPWGGC